MKGFGDKEKSTKKRFISIENNQIKYEQLINKAFQLQAIGKKFGPNLGTIPF